MNLMNFIIWLSVGALIGWFASRMVDAEQRRARNLILVSDQYGKKS